MMSGRCESHATCTPCSCSPPPSGEHSTLPAASSASHSGRSVSWWGTSSPLRHDAKLKASVNMQFRWLLARLLPPGDAPCPYGAWPLRASAKCRAAVAGRASVSRPASTHQPLARHRATPSLSKVPTQLHGSRAVWLSRLHLRYSPSMARPRRQFTVLTQSPAPLGCLVGQAQSCSILPAAHGHAVELVLCLAPSRKFGSKRPLQLRQQSASPRTRLWPRTVAHGVECVALSGRHLSLHAHDAEPRRDKRLSTATAAHCIVPAAWWSCPSASTRARRRLQAHHMGRVHVHRPVSR